MRKIFLPLVLALASVTMFAEEITSVSLTVEFPKVGQSTNHGAYLTVDNPNFNVIGNVSIPENAGYTVLKYCFRPRENSIPNETFLPETQYRFEIYLLPTTGNAWPSVWDDGCECESILTSQMTITINGASPAQIGSDDIAGVLTVSAYFIPENVEALDNTMIDFNATKCILNGQLLIKKNGKTYNAIGEEIR